MSGARELGRALDRSPAAVQALHHSDANVAPQPRDRRRRRLRRRARRRRHGGPDLHADPVPRPGGEQRLRDGHGRDHRRSHRRRDGFRLHLRRDRWRRARTCLHGRPHPAAVGRPRAGDRLHARDDGVHAGTDHARQSGRLRASARHVQPGPGRRLGRDHGCPGAAADRAPRARPGAQPGPSRTRCGRCSV